jgi:hypothetical protein
METLSTACEHEDGSVTEIEVCLGQGVREELKGSVEDVEELLRRCVWRFIGTKHETNEIEGDRVSFVLDRDRIVELVSDLKKIDSKLSN